MTRQTLKDWWDYVQALFDLDGDLWMSAFTAVILVRLMGVPLWHWSAVTPSESALYASAITAFAYSNKGPTLKP